MKKYNFSDLVFDKKWEYNSPIGELYYKSGLIQNKIFYTKIIGIASINEVKNAIPSFENVFNSGLLKNSKYCRIVDYSELKSASIEGRKIYAATIKRLNQENNCEAICTYICGASLWLKLTLLTFSKFVNQKFIFVDNVNDAFSEINKNNTFKVKPESIQNDNDEICVTRNHLNEIFSKAGQLLFEYDELDYEVKLSEDNPLIELFHMLNIVKKDIDDLINIQKADTLKFNKIFNNNPTLIAISVFPERKIVEVNKAFLSTLEYEKDEVIGKTSTELEIFADINEHALAVEQLKTDGFLRNFELKVQSKNKRIFYGLFSGEIIEHMGKTYFLTVMTDVTTQKLAEEKANAANIVKSRFLANMSHEIRTPLNAVIGFSQLLNNTKLDSEQKEFVGYINESGNVLLNLINDILDFSKIEAGKLILNKSKANLKEIINQSIISVKLSAEKKNIEIRLNIDDQIPDYLIIDSLKLKQVLINLLNNAIKFTEKGFVELAVNVLDINKNNVKLYFSVSDTGIGISYENQTILFESFRQIDSSLTRKQEGTGLGLSISNGIIKLMGGEIKVESELNKGSKFYFTIDCNLIYEDILITSDNINENTGSTISTKSENNELRILIVEDRLLNTVLLTKILKNLYPFVKIIDVKNGQEAIDILNSFMPDIIFMDIQMPIMDGYETTIKIRSINDNKIKNTPIIALSADAIFEQKEKAFAVGMNGFLSKPISVSKLSGFIDKYSKLKTKEIKIDFEKEIDSEVIDIEDFIQRTGLEKDEVINLIYLSMTEINEIVDKLNINIKNNDLISALKNAHSLKGISINYSFKNLNKLAFEMEQLISKNEPNISDKLNDINKEWFVIKKIINYN